MQKKGQGKFILLVEDDAEIQEVLSSALQREGFKVLTTDTEGEAVRLLSNQKFHCIVCDLYLKSGNGTNLVQQVRRSNTGFNCHSAILAISGEFDSQSVMKMKTLIDGALVKPFAISEFVEHVQRLAAAGDRAIRAAA